MASCEAEVAKIGSKLDKVMNGTKNVRLSWGVFSPLLFTLFGGKKGESCIESSDYLCVSRNAMLMNSWMPSPSCR